VTAYTATLDKLLDKHLMELLRASTISTRTGIMEGEEALPILSAYLPPLLCPPLMDGGWRISYECWSRTPLTKQIGFCGVMGADSGLELTWVELA